jgi:dihydroxy-acid dehydratase
MINIDVERRLLEVEIDSALLAKRLSRWKPPAPRFPGGVFGKYSALVTSASEGAVTRPKW